MIAASVLAVAGLGRVGSALREPPVDVVFVRWIPGPQPLALAGPNPEGGPTAEELERLRALGLAGQLRIETLLVGIGSRGGAATGGSDDSVTVFRAGRGGQGSRVVVVMHRQLGEVRSLLPLPVPEEGSVLHVQSDDGGWTAAPRSFRARDARIELRAGGSGERQAADTTYFIHLDSGAGAARRSTGRADRAGRGGGDRRARAGGKPRMTSATKPPGRQSKGELRPPRGLGGGSVVLRLPEHP